MGDQELISIILPVHNQADHIGDVVRDYAKALVKVPRPHEILLVLNNCRDHSLQVCEALAAKVPNVRVLKTQKGGWGVAVKLGLLEARGDLLCYTNSARTTGQDLTLVLLYAVVYSEVIVKADRKIRDSWWRRLGSLFYNLECRALFDMATWDVNGTPKVFSRRFSKLLNVTEDGDLIDAEFAAICRSENYPVLEVPILSSQRHGGKSTTGFRTAVRLYWGAYKLSRKRGRVPAAVASQ
jgi:glycosyltransferase involved in cell wall biosynthesis